MAPFERSRTMRMPAFQRQKTVLASRHKRRIHSIVPWIQNPLQGVDKKQLVFAPRHEASTLELFFDLFFVANLATFTAYHYINNHSTLFAYIGFFAIIWVSWFHTVLHDVRFENDSIYSRVCKTIMMVVFVGFALVGSGFAPGTPQGNNNNFRILCYTLVTSRVLFSIQYSVLLFFVARAGRADLYIPLSLNVLTYVLATAAYGGLIGAFPDSKPVDEANGIYSVWWVVMALETIATIAVSCSWRMLSFKRTHLVERMGLLTLIVIGEGAIGVTKTVSRLMGKTGLDPEGCGLTLCIVLLLVATWTIYFDNHPHGHFGTIRQQIWSCLHFPIHLAIVGLAEGAQQIALARSIASKTLKLESSVVKYCLSEHLDGEKLAEKLNELIEPLHLDKKSDSLSFVGTITDDIARIEETSGICRPGLTGTTTMDLPDALQDLIRHLVAAMYSAFGMKIPLQEDVILSMVESWKLIYRYFWAAFMLLSACFLVVMILIRTTKLDAYDYVTFFVRAFVIIIAGVLLSLSATKDLMYGIMATPAILPFSVALLYIIIFSDRVGAWFANRRNIRSGDPLIGADPGHGHGHDDDHDDSGEHGAANDKQSLLVSAEPLTSSSPPHHHPHHHHQHHDSTSSPPPVPPIPTTHYNPLATWGASNTNLTNPNAPPQNPASIVPSPPTYAPARFYDAPPPPAASPPTFISPSNSPPLPAQPQAQQTYYAREQRQQQRQQQQHHGRSASQGSQGGGAGYGGYAQGQGQEYVPLQGEGQYAGHGY
ncbi:bacterial low temperature requirement A protein-domain-containing protein [Chaetomium sp. MPI-SDFR-AT-0129]|nr:bacterial low temperature requirement A protein-domain-containing protein [Chaetomium sp. MPI-SDFR-AT-0129]